jgi:hypothetical protein
MVGMNLIKVHYLCVWKHHNETPSYNENSLIFKRPKENPTKSLNH